MTETRQVDRGRDERLARMADGLDTLIRFHDREIDADLLGQLRRFNVVRGLHELIEADEGQATAKAFATALDGLGTDPSDAVLDDLAADFADIYLTHGYRVSPNGSVWLTEDRLERQMPMFEVRDWYEHYGVAVPNWRMRADDHLVHELQFVSYLCRLGGEVAALDAGRFMDLHILPWVPEFCRRARERVRHTVYAGLMDLTLCHLEELRLLIESVTGTPRVIPATVRPDTARTPEPDVAPYVPGTAESW